MSGVFRRSSLRFSGAPRIRAIFLGCVGSVGRILDSQFVAVLVSSYRCSSVSLSKREQFKVS